MPRFALFITGAPATGKSSLAEGLARALPDFALLQKDLLKEYLSGALHSGALQSGALCSGALPEDVSISATFPHQLSEVAMGLLWTIAAHCPRVILEANFPTRETRERERFQALDAKKLEVHCWCPPDIAIRRFAARATGRHPAHTLKSLPLEVYEKYEPPFALGPLIEVDTTEAVDLQALIARVEAQWRHL